VLGTVVAVGPAVGVAVAVGATVGVVVAVGSAVGVAVAVSGSVVAASAMTCEGPNEVKARATTATRATVTDGYATAALRRMRRIGPLLMRFTGIFLGLLALEKRLRVVR